MSKYTTGEMAKMCNVSVRTVQFYDTKGVLHPSELTEGGRRLYSEDDLTKLQLICTLKTIGLSLDSIKSIMESELSEKILTILLDEQVKQLSDEIDERQKQLEMIAVIKESIRNQATNPENSILDVEHTMKKKNNSRNTKKLTLIYLAVVAWTVPNVLFLAWLAISGIWWAVAVYLFFAVFGISVAALQLKDTVFICPNCDAVFKIRPAFFTTGSHKVRWAKCPECGERGWCVLRKQK
jgi:DNA-binding transcriptional MerR regulator